MHTQVHQITKWDRLARFIILGNELPSYQVSSEPEPAQCIYECAEEDINRTVDTIVELQTRAPKASPSILAMAMLSTYPQALARLNDVCRTGTHILHFARDVERFRGWGRGLRRAVAEWYTSKEPDRLAYQVTKYRQRDGWNHRDLLRLSHPVFDDPQSVEVAKFLTGKELSNPPRLIEGYQLAQRAESVNEVARLIDDYKLTWEHIPTHFLRDSEVWEALLPNLPMTALVRNLGRLTNIGLLKPLSTITQQVINKLYLADTLHPVVLLNALKTYRQGHGVLGSLQWSPVTSVCDALENVFYISFNKVTPTNKRTMISLDVSGSMAFENISGMSLTPREASAALALVTMRTETNYEVFGFTDELRRLPISKHMQLNDVINAVSFLHFGATDCAQPMLRAAQDRLEVDTFIIYTDNETWAGAVAPSDALQQYRISSGIDAKLIVVGMTATNYSIADPNDHGMLDVVGFDSATPQLISDFSA
jgi:60 kDa SS-A/Ro ribonucleoprotein